MFQGHTVAHMDRLTHGRTHRMLADLGSAQLQPACSSACRCRCQALHANMSPETASLSPPLSRRLGTRTGAKKKTEENAAGEWAALARDEEDNEDPEVLQAVTEVCNRGLRLMLKGDAFRIEQFKDDLSKLGQRFVDKGNLQGATFVYATYQMADHNLPKEHENLKGQYLEAFTKMFNILEDSGWRLKMEGEQEDDDDSDLLPDQSGGYYQNAGL